MSDSLRSHGLQHTRLPHPSPSPRVYSNSHPLDWWYHPTISSSVALFFCLQFFPASRSFPVSQLLASGGQSIRASFSISPSNEYSGLISFKIDLFDLLAVQGTLKSLLQHHTSKASILRRSAFFTVQLSHPYMTTGKTTASTRWTFVSKVMSLLQLTDLQHSLKGVQGGVQEWNTLFSEKIWQTRSSDRSFQEKILWAQFLQLLISRKALMSTPLMSTSGSKSH